MQSTTLESQQKRLNQLIGLISDQEKKLNRLKLLSNQAKEQTATNLELSNELNTVNIAIKNKDDELKKMLDRVDELTAHLFNYRMTKSFSKSKNNKKIDVEPGLKLTTTTTNNTRHPRKSITTSNASTNNSCDQEEQKSKKQGGDTARRVSFEPLALLLDAALEGELDLVIKTSKQVPDINASHDECVTALHNSVLAGHYDVAEYLIKAGCDINVPDSDGWTPLHCAASCNNLPLAKLLIENGASIYATTTGDNSTPAMACEKEEKDYEECYNYLVNIQNNLGVINNGVVYALYDYKAQQEDELSFETGDKLIILRRDDDSQDQGWWWAQKRIHQQLSVSSDVETKEGFIPKNLIGLYPRVTPAKKIACSDANNSNGTCDVTNSIGDLVID